VLANQPVNRAIVRGIMIAPPTPLCRRPARARSGNTRASISKPTSASANGAMSSASRWRGEEFVEKIPINKQHKLKRNYNMKILKTMFALGIVAGLAAVSAKAQCDGPVVVPGYTAGSCSCSNYQSDPLPSTGACTASSGIIGYRNTYTTCGGDGYTSCTTSNEVVGYEYTGCLDTPDYAAYSSLLISYDDCVDNDRPHGMPWKCLLPWCGWNTCTMGTGGTPLKADVEVSLGDDCGG
jgi:hypothetical protein